MNSLSERQPRATTWHVESSTVDLSLVGDNGGPGTHTIHAISSTDPFQPEPLNAALKEGLQLVAHAAHRVWDELYIHKKPVSGQMFFVVLLLSDISLLALAVISVSVLFSPPFFFSFLLFFFFSFSLLHFCCCSFVINNFSAIVCIFVLV